MKGEYKQFNCSMCGFMIRAKTDDEVIKHVKAHVACVHGTLGVKAEMVKKISEGIRPVTVYMP